MDTKQITLRLPGELHEALKGEVESMGISLNELILLKLNPLNVDFSQTFGRTAAKRTQSLC